MCGFRGRKSGLRCAPNGVDWGCRMRAVTVVGVVLLGAVAPAAADVVGTARVVDGDTIVVEGVTIRLEGIDAPERAQTCEASGVHWRCGEMAGAWLREFLADREVACVEKGHDRYGRVLATCFVGGENLNARIVAEGWAVNFDRYTHDYKDSEELAKRRGAGLWRGTFELPWEWRRHR